MTRTSKIWLALSIGAVCVAVFATRPANAQSVADQGKSADSESTDSTERPHPLLVMQICLNSVGVQKLNLASPLIYWW